MTQLNNYAMAPMSLGHTFGNMTAFMTEYIKSMFPQNYFKTINISSSIAYRHFNIFDNTKGEFIKKRKPMLIVRPRIQMENDSDMFLNGTFLTQRITDNYMDLDYSNLQPFIRDVNKGIDIKYLMNRMRMYFDVTIIVESQMEQINQTMFLKNRVRQDHPFFIETALESNIPKELIEMVATEAGKDMTDTKSFLEYLNGISTFPITYKMKNSTGNDEYFRYYPVEVDTTFTNLTMDDGSRRGFVDDAFGINFTISTEFFTSGLYYYFTEDPSTIEKLVDVSTSDDAILKPIFTVLNLFDIEAPPGWNMYATTMYKVEKNGVTDELDISSLFNHSMKAAIKFHQDKGLPMKPLIKVFVMKDNAQMTAVDDFDMNYETLTLLTKKGNVTSTYRLIIYINTLYMNTLVSSILDANEEK